MSAFEGASTQADAAIGPTPVEVSESVPQAHAARRLWLGNAGLMLASLVGVFLFLEYVVFGLIFVPSDLLPNVSINHVVRYVPDTVAVFRHPDGTRSTVTINEDGWNSSKRSYALDPVPGLLRVAVVGDSYVHGAFVNTSEGFPDVIERSLKGHGIKAEVYRFGMDGAPLSQYLFMLRQEVVRYRPDVVVVQLIHNDFDESYRFLGTRYNSSFMKIGTDQLGNPVEIAPQDFEPGWPDLMRASNMFRYLYYSTNASMRLKSLVTRYVWGREERYSEEFVSSAVDIRNITETEKIRWVTRYVMGEMRKLAAEKGFLLALSMDGVRDAIYAGKPRSQFAVSKLNDIAAEAAAENNIPFLDLQQTFADDYAAHGARLEFPFDWHWNQRGNELAGNAIADMLMHDPWLLPARPKRQLSQVAPAASAQPAAQP